MNIMPLTGISATMSTVPFRVSNLGNRIESLEAVTAILTMALTFATYNTAPWTKQPISYDPMPLASPAPDASHTPYALHAINSVLAIRNRYYPKPLASPTPNASHTPIPVIQQNFNALGIDILHRAGPALATQNNFNALIASGEHARAVVEALRVLHNVSLALVTQRNFDALIASGPNARAVARGLTTLHRANPVLLTPKNINALIASGPNARAVAIGLVALYHTNPALLTQENINALIGAKENIGEIVEGLQALHGAQPTTLVTQEYFDLLFDRNEVGEREPILLTENNFNRLFGEDHPTDGNGHPILYTGHDGTREITVPLPARTLPTPLSEESFWAFRDAFMAAKYNPSSQAAKNAKQRAIKAVEVSGRDFRTLFPST
jgi:hypothetical protein